MSDGYYQYTPFSGLNQKPGEFKAPVAENDLGANDFVTEAFQARKAVKAGEAWGFATLPRAEVDYALRPADELLQRTALWNDMEMQDLNTFRYAGMDFDADKLLDTKEAEAFQRITGQPVPENKEGLAPYVHVRQELAKFMDAKNDEQDALKAEVGDAKNQQKFFKLASLQGVHDTYLPELSPKANELLRNSMGEASQRTHAHMVQLNGILSFKYGQDPKELQALAAKDLDPKMPALAQAGATLGGDKLDKELKLGNQLGKAAEYIASIKDEGERNMVVAALNEHIGRDVESAFGALVRENVSNVALANLTADGKLSPEGAKLVMQMRSSTLEKALPTSYWGEVAYGAADSMLKAGVTLGASAIISPAGGAVVGTLVYTPAGVVEARSRGDSVAGAVGMGATNAVIEMTADKLGFGSAKAVGKLFPSRLLASKWATKVAGSMSSVGDQVKVMPKLGALAGTAAGVGSEVGTEAIQPTLEIVAREAAKLTGVDVDTSKSLAQAYSDLNGTPWIMTTVLSAGLTSAPMAYNSAKSIEFRNNLADALQIDRSVFARMPAEQQQEELAGLVRDVERFKLAESSLRAAVGSLVASNLENTVAYMSLGDRYRKTDEGYEDKQTGTMLTEQQMSASMIELAGLMDSKRQADFARHVLNQGIVSLPIGQHVDFVETEQALLADIENIEALHIARTEALIAADPELSRMVREGTVTVAEVAESVEYRAMQHGQTIRLLDGKANIHDLVEETSEARLKQSFATAPEYANEHAQNLANLMDLLGMEHNIDKNVDYSAAFTQQDGTTMLALYEANSRLALALALDANTQQAAGTVASQNEWVANMLQYEKQSINELHATIEVARKIKELEAAGQAPTELLDLIRESANLSNVSNLATLFTGTPSAAAGVSLQRLASGMRNQAAGGQVSAQKAQAISAELKRLDEIPRMLRNNQTAQRISKNFAALGKYVTSVVDKVDKVAGKFVKIQRAANDDIRKATELLDKLMAQAPGAAKNFGERLVQLEETIDKLASVFEANAEQANALREGYSPARVDEAEALLSAAEGLANVLMDVRADISELQADLDTIADIKSISAELTPQQVSDLAVREQEAVAKVAEAADAKVAETQAKYDKAIADLEASKTEGVAALKSLNKDHEEQIKALEKEHKEELKTVKGDTKAGNKDIVDALKAKHAEKIDALKAKHKEKVAKLEATRKERLTKLNNYWIEQMQKAKESKAKAVEAARAKAKEKSAAAKERFTARIEAMKKKHLESFERLRAKLNGAIDEAAVAKRKGKDYDRRISQYNAAGMLFPNQFSEQQLAELRQLKRATREADLNAKYADMVAEVSMGIPLENTGAGLASSMLWSYANNPVAFAANYQRLMSSGQAAVGRGIEDVVNGYAAVCVFTTLRRMRNASGEQVAPASFTRICDELGMDAQALWDELPEMGSARKLEDAMSLGERIPELHDTIMAITEGLRAGGDVVVELAAHEALELRVEKIRAKSIKSDALDKAPPAQKAAVYIALMSQHGQDVAKRMLNSFLTQKADENVAAELEDLNARMQQAYAQLVEKDVTPQDGTVITDEKHLDAWRKGEAAKSVILPALKSVGVDLAAELSGMLEEFAKDFTQYARGLDLLNPKKGSAQQQDFDAYTRLKDMFEGASDQFYSAAQGTNPLWVGAQLADEMYNQFAGGLTLDGRELYDVNALRTIEAAKRAMKSAPQRILDGVSKATEVGNALEQGVWELAKQLGLNPPSRRGGAVTELGNYNSNKQKNSGLTTITNLVGYTQNIGQRLGQAVAAAKKRLGGDNAAVKYLGELSDLFNKYAADQEVYKQAAGQTLRGFIEKCSSAKTWAGRSKDWADFNSKPTNFRYVGKDGGETKNLTEGQIAYLILAARQRGMQPHVDSINPAAEGKQTLSEALIEWLDSSRATSMFLERFIHHMPEEMARQRQTITTVGAGTYLDNLVMYGTYYFPIARERHTGSEDMQAGVQDTQITTASLTKRRLGGSAPVRILNAGEVFNSYIHEVGHTSYSAKLMELYTAFKANEKAFITMLSTLLGSQTHAVAMHKAIIAEINPESRAKLDASGAKFVSTIANAASVSMLGGNIATGLVQGSSLAWASATAGDVSFGSYIKAIFDRRFTAGKLKGDKRLSSRVPDALATRLKQIGESGGAEKFGLWRRFTDWSLQYLPGIDGVVSRFTAAHYLSARAATVEAGGGVYTDAEAERDLNRLIATALQPLGSASKSFMAKGENAIGQLTSTFLLSEVLKNVGYVYTEFRNASGKDRARYAAKAWVLGNLAPYIVGFIRRHLFGDERKEWDMDKLVIEAMYFATAGADMLGAGAITQSAIKWAENGKWAVYYRGLPVRGDAFVGAIKAGSKLMSRINDEAEFDYPDLSPEELDKQIAMGFADALTLVGVMAGLGNASSVRDFILNLSWMTRFVGRGSQLKGNIPGLKSDEKEWKDEDKQADEEFEGIYLRRLMEGGL